jgi:16S rRNA (adenine1518-N6/adenine1519-N6)-dimethyltransferase
MDIQSGLNRLSIIPDPMRDQFFLTDEKIINKIVGFADLNQNDTVLEVGAGVGNLTAEIANRAKRVIAFEIDTRFKPFLDKLPQNVEVHYENAWNYVQLHGKFKKKKEYNKVVANLPYSFVEQFLHNLTFLEYDKVILLVPIKFIKKIDGHDVFGSFFKTKILLKVPKSKFYPVPRTNSVVIDLIKLPDPIENKNPGLFLRQYMYQHEDQLVKNSLTEGIIKYARLVLSTNVTKNRARGLVAQKQIDRSLLTQHPNTPEIYEQVSEKFKDLEEDLA